MTVVVFARIEQDEIPGKPGFSGRTAKLISKA
jgi:hypothetical protein